MQLPSVNVATVQSYVLHYTQWDFLLRKHTQMQMYECLLIVFNDTP